MKIKIEYKKMKEIFIVKLDNKLFLNYYLKEKRKSVSDTQERLYNYLIKRFENEPSLLNAQDTEIIHQHAELMELLTTCLFPVVASDHRHIFALAAPYRFSVFYYSDYFREIFFDSEDGSLCI